MELFLHELGVADAAQGRGAGRALVAALAERARERGCHDMWVLTEVDDAAALRTYAAASAARLPELAYLEWRLEPPAAAG